MWGPRRGLLGGLVVGVSALIVSGFAGQVSRVLTGHDHVLGLVPFLNPDREFNLPSLVSVVLLAACSGLLFVAAQQDHGDGGRRSPYWWVLGIGFLAMAIDEWMSVHELLVPVLRRPDLPGVFHFAWVMAALPLVLALGAVFAGFWLRLPRGTRFGVALAAAMYLGGAIGIEMAGGAYAAGHGQATLWYAALVAIEEWAEMVGVAILLTTLLGHIDLVRATEATLPAGSEAQAMPAASRSGLVGRQVFRRRT